MSILPARRFHRQPGLPLSVAAAVLAAVLAAALAASQPAQAEAIHQIVSYGQSVSLGTGAVAPISTEPHPSNLMFSSGVRAQFGEGDATANRAGLVPFQESRYYWLGETPVAGMLEMIDRTAWGVLHSLPCRTADVVIVLHERGRISDERPRSGRCRAPSASKT